MSRLDAGTYDAAPGARRRAIGRAARLRPGNTNDNRPVGGLLKRAIDVALAATILVLLFPLFLLIAVVLHMGLARSVFTAEQRIGFAGRRFTSYVFTTSPDNGQRNSEPWLATCLVSTLANSGLDRLPELVSILRGDMSFVGPRPVEAGRPGSHRSGHLAARPGLIGLCRSGRHDRLGSRRRAAMDRYYVRHWTVWLDIAVLVRGLRDAS
jgi:exopolysaccharide production protein ExoY